MNNNSSLNKGMGKKEPRIWNGTEESLLKKWGEQAASYRILHNRAYRKYKYLTALFTIPVIIVSTLTGTANFSQGTIIQIYPSFDVYLPLMIGALNLISGIITTIGQFLRVSELNEAHRNSSISYGKFARNISTELSLPPNERTYSGLDFIQICRNEMDRLIEQSPEIGMEIITKFERNKKFKNIIKPEVINISSIVPYKPTKEEKTQETVANAAGMFRKGFLNNKLKDLEPSKDSSSKFTEYNNKRNVELELSELRDNGIANNPMIKNKVNAVFESNINKSLNKNYDKPLSVNSIKNKFNNVDNNTNNIPPKMSLSDLISNDNLDILQKEKNDEDKEKKDIKKFIKKPKINQEQDNSFHVNVDLLKEDLLKNIDETLEKADLDEEVENKIISDISKKYKEKNTKRSIVNPNINNILAEDPKKKLAASKFLKVMKDNKNNIENITDNINETQEVLDNSNEVVEEVVEEVNNNSDEVVEEVVEEVNNITENIQEEIGNQTEEEIDMDEEKNKKKNA